MRAAVVFCCVFVCFVIASLSLLFSVCVMVLCVSSSCVYLCAYVLTSLLCVYVVVVVVFCGCSFRYVFVC